MGQEQPVAATGAAATPNSGSNLEQKHAEYEQTALRLSLCSDESLAVVLRKLLPRAVMELMTCPPVSLPKVIGIVNSCLRRVKESQEIPVPAEELLYLLAAAERQQRTGEKQQLLEQQLAQLQLPPIRPSNLSVVRGIVPLFVSIVIPRRDAQNLCSLGLLLLQKYDEWATANYPKMLLLLLECLTKPQVLQMLKHTCNNPAGMSVLEAFAAVKTEVLVPNTAAATSSSSSKLPCCSKPSPPLLAALQAMCELMLLGGDFGAAAVTEEPLQKQQLQQKAEQVARGIDWTAFHRWEKLRSQNARRGKIGAFVRCSFVDVLGSQQTDSALIGETASTTPATTSEPGRGLPVDTVKLWENCCRLSRQELVLQQTRAVQLLTKVASAVPVADEKVAAAAFAAAAPNATGTSLEDPEAGNYAQRLGNVANAAQRTVPTALATGAAVETAIVPERGEKMVLPPVVLGPIILGSCAPFASISDPCTASLTRLATVSNTEDELLIQLLFDLVLLRPLRQLQQLLRLPFLLGQTSLRTQDSRGPLPSKVQQKLLQQLCKSRAAAERRFCFAVLQLQWEALGLLQQTLQWGIGPGQPTARVSAALSLLQWCLRLQRWFCCDVHAVDAAAATGDAPCTDAPQQHSLQQRVLCPSGARVSCLLLDFFSRALEQLLLVAVPPASELVASDFLGPYTAFAASSDGRNRNAFTGAQQVLQQFMQCSAAVFAADAVLSPDLVYQISLGTIPPTLRPSTAAELLLQPATRELLPLLLDAISTACRVFPYSPILNDTNGSSPRCNGACSLVCEVEDDVSWSESFGMTVTERMLQLMQQLLLLLPRAIEADAQQKGAKVQSQKRRAASAALSLSGTLDNPTTPSAMQALRSCGDWLAMRLGSLRQTLQHQNQLQQQQQQHVALRRLQHQHDYLEEQLITLLDWTVARWLNPPEIAAVLHASQSKKTEFTEPLVEASQSESPVSSAASQQLLLQEALRLAAKAFPTSHPAHSFYCMVCLTLDTSRISSGRGSSNTSKEASVAETAAGLLKQCERQELPSFAALLHFSLPRLDSNRARAVSFEGAVSQLHAAHLSIKPRDAQQQLAAAVNSSPEEAAERLLPLATRLAELLHGDLRISACERRQRTNQLFKEDSGADAASGSTAAAAPEANLPTKKLRLTSKEALEVAGGASGLCAEDMRLFSVLLLPLLVARHADEASNASMRCTFCRCWMALLRWQQQQQQCGGQGASLLPLLSLQIPLLVSSVLFSPLSSSFTSASFDADPEPEKKRRPLRFTVQQSQEDARRAAADLVLFVAAGLQEQQQHQEKEPKEFQLSGQDLLLAAFLPFLSGSAFDAQQLLEPTTFFAGPSLHHQQQTPPNDALYLQLKEAVNQHQELSLHTQEQQKQQTQRLPTPGELAGSLVALGSAFATGKKARSSSGGRDPSKELTLQAIASVLKHFCFWAATYCGEDCVQGSFPLQEKNQHGMTAFAAYAQPWGDSLLLCSLEALSRALGGHWQSVLVAILSLDEGKQHAHDSQGAEEQNGNRDVAAIESLLSLLTTISKAGLSRCAVPETGSLLPAANTSQRNGLLLLHSSLQSVASLASLCAAQACKSCSSSSKRAAWTGPYHRAVRCLLETAHLAAPPLRSASALAVVRFVLDLHRMRSALAAETVAAETEMQHLAEETAISGEIKQVLRLFVQLVQLQQMDAASDGKKVSAGEEEQAEAAALDAAADSAAANGINGDLARLVFASPNLQVSLWQRVSSSAVCWLAALLLHAKHLPEVSTMLLQFQRVFLSRVGDADAFVGHCAWRGLSRCLLAASLSKTSASAVTSKGAEGTTAQKATETTAVANTGSNERSLTMRDMLLHELSLHVGSRISTGPSEQALKMQGFSLQRQQQQKDNSKDESNGASCATSGGLQDKDGGMTRLKLLRQLLQVAKDIGHTAAVYALLDQPLPPLFVEPLCVAACDVSTPCFCLPALRQQLLRVPHRNVETVASAESATPTVGTETSAISESVEPGDETVKGAAITATEELETLVVEAQVAALRFCCPLSLVFGLSVYSWHSVAPLRQAAEMLSQSVYGISSFADLVGSGNGLTMFVSALKQQKHAKQKVQLSTWQHIVQQVVKRLQSPNQLLREAACKAGADVLKRGHDWGEVEPFFADLWLSGARCLDDVVDEVRAAAAALGRTLKALTVELCREGPPLVASVSLLQKICELHGGNKELRILCLDVLGDSVSNYIASKRLKQSRETVKVDEETHARPVIDGTSTTTSDSSSSSNKDWLVPLVLFLIEGLAAFEPRAFSFHQFHAERLHGVSQTDFEKTRVSLSQTGRAAQILKDIARHMDLNAVGPLVQPLVHKLRASVGVASRCGVCFFVCWLFDEWGSKIPEVAIHSKRLLKAFARSLLDPSPTVRGAAIEAFSVVCKFASPQAMHEVLEKQLLQLPARECINPQEREETQLAVGSALLHVSRRASELFNEELKGTIGAMAFCLRHSSSSGVSEIYRDLWMEVAGSDAFGIPRYLCPIKAKLQEQLALSVREERLTAARAVSTIAAHVASIWRDGIPSEFTDLQEVSVIRDLQEAVTGRVLQGQASFKGAAPLYIAALDASAALDGMLWLQGECGSTAPGKQHGAESRSPDAANRSGATVAKRLLRLHASDKLAVVVHIPSWLQLLPPATRASQPFDELLSLVHYVLQRVDQGFPDENESGEEGGLEKGNAMQQWSTSFTSNRQLNSRDETALRAGMLALLRLLGTDICLRLGVDSEPKATEGTELEETDIACLPVASWITLPANEEGKGVAAFTAWKRKGSDSCSSGNSRTSSSGHAGIEEFLDLFVKYQLTSVQLKADLLQRLSDLLRLLTSLSVCLCAVAEPRKWWAVFSRLAEQLSQRKYPRLRLAAANTAADLVRHYIHVGSIRTKQHEDQLHKQKKEGVAEEDAALTASARIEGGDTELHRNFRLPVGDSLTVSRCLAAVESGITGPLQAASAGSQGTWSVFSLCVSQPSQNEQQQQEEDSLSEMGGRVQEMQRHLRLRLSEAQEREQACCRMSSNGTATNPELPR